MSNIEKIKAKIERLMRETNDTQFEKGERYMCRTILDFIDPLPEEGFASVNLGDEGDGLRAYESTKSVHVSYRDVKDLSQRLEVADSLPEEKPSEDLEDEIKKFIEEYGYERGGDKLLIAIVARHFAEWQKSQMLKGAMEGRAHPEECEIWVNLLGYGYQYNDGDKVKIIIVKED